MTPQPPRNAIVPVSLSGIGVTLGYVTVDGFWRQQAGPAAHWRSLPASLSTLWKARVAPVTVWREEN